MTSEKKPTLSAGCIVMILVIGGFIVSAIALLAVAFYRAEFLRARQGVPAINETPVIGKQAPAQVADKPAPTPGQIAALDGGTHVVWNRYGYSWTVPKGWDVETTDDSSFSVKSPGSEDAGWLNVSVSAFPASFPYETSLNAMYQQAVVEQDAGRYTEARWLELDGVRGVLFREATPANPGDVQRLQWQGYRSTADGVQLVSVMTHSTGKGFPHHVDAMYAVLYSTRLTSH